MSISAAQSRLTVRVGGADYAVVSVTGQEAFNRPFSFALELVVPGYQSLTNQLGSSVRMSMLATSGQPRTVFGLVTQVAHVMGLPDQRQLWRLEVSSHLYRLQQVSDTRLLLDHSLPEIIQRLCNRHGLDDNALFCDWGQSYPARPTTLQAGESDFDFLARLCSRHGILFWSAASDEQEVLHFADTASHCRPLARPALEYRANAGLDHDATDNDVLTMELGAQLVSDCYLVHDVAESAPGQALLSERQLPGAGKSAYGTTLVCTGRGVTSTDEASAATELLAHIGAAQQQKLTITSHAVDLRVGRIVRIDADRFGSGISGDYLITGMTHKLHQYAGLGLGGDSDCPYSNAVVLVPRETPYRVPESKRPKVPLAVTARIESKDPTAQLDSAGRTRYRQHNDSLTKPFAQNSIFTRRLQPYGGTGNGHQPGFHTPLQDGAEILVSCLNGDPDRPVIIGSLPNPETPSPVSASSAAHNRLRSANDQELCLDDTIDAPVITLRTFAGHNMLHLNASKAEHLIRLATEQGLAEFYAKQTLNTTSGDTLTETVGNNRIQVVEDRHQTITNSAEIHHQSATDVLLRGANNIQLESGENIEFEAGNDMRIDIREAMNIKVDGSSAAININSGSMILDSRGAIKIQGDGGGDICIGQAGGGIKMDPSGNITLFGTNVNFAGTVSMSGKINMDVTSPPSVSLASGVTATAAIGIGTMEGQAGPTPAPNWVELEYLYADGSGVAGASYTIYDDSDNVIAGGVLDKQGKAYVILPADKEDIRVDYGGDPGEVEQLVTSEPQPHPEEQGWFERMTTTLKGAWDTTKDAADWTWGALQGDFNEDATIGQIATNAIITAIPVVDQVGDVRDITANIKLLVWDKRYKEAAIWFALVVTLVGLIPTLGSLLKGVFKLIWKGAKLDEVLALFNYFMKGNGVSWLKELKAGKLKDYIDEAAQYGHTIMDKVTDLLTDLKSHVPQKFQNIHAKIQDTLMSLQTVKGQINAQFAKVGDELGLKIGKMLDEGVENSVRGSSRKTLAKKQRAVAPSNSSAGPNPNVVSGQGSHVKMDGHKIYDSNYSALSTNPSAQYRFSDPTFRSTGGDVYFGENVAVSYFEVRKNSSGKSLFVGDVKIDNILDLTDPDVLKNMNIDYTMLTKSVDTPIQQKSIYGYTNNVSNQAYQAGYNGILYESSRKSAGNNKALILFDGRYKQSDIELIMDRKI